MKLSKQHFQSGANEATAIAIARDVLLGATLCSNIDGKFCSGKIVEVEVYLQHGDLGCHSRNGPTKKCASMFMDGGAAYVYHLHRYDALNIVIGPANAANAILIRALEPISGIDVMRERAASFARKYKTHLRDEADLCRGPGRLTQALGITTKMHDGIDLALSPELWIEARGGSVPETDCGKRIGLGKSAGRDADRNLRFVIRNSRFLSQPIFKV